MVGTGWDVWRGRWCWFRSCCPGSGCGWRSGASGLACLKPGCSRCSRRSPSRTDPPCPHFQRCGGCQYQHAGYQFQLEQKRLILEEVFRRVGKLEPPQAEVIAGPPWEYRNRTQLHLQGGEIGYFEHGSHRLCPVERCPVCSPKINETLAALRGMLRDPRLPHFVESIELFSNETEVQLNVLVTQRPVSRRFFEWCGERSRAWLQPSTIRRLAQPGASATGPSFRSTAF